MYLLIDAGNSRLKFACHDGHTWLARGVLEKPADLAGSLPGGFIPEQIVASCVAAPELRQDLQDILGGMAPVEWLRTSAERCGLRCAYTDPVRLGPDRWAAAIGAWHHVGTDCLVVSAGTATTVDVVRAPGVFAGGSILPGLDLMRESLARGTAALPLTIDTPLPAALDAPATDTRGAINSGCLHAQLGAIERMAALLPAGSPILLSGGNARTLAAYLHGTVQTHPWLVMDGLLRVAVDATTGANS